MTLWEVSSSLLLPFSEIPLSKFVSTHVMVQLGRGVWGWLTGSGDDGGYWVWSQRCVRYTECGCGNSFLRILNAEPVSVAPRLPVGSWCPLCAAPSLRSFFVHWFSLFVIYFFLFYLFFWYIYPFLLYTLVCAISSYFAFSVLVLPLYRLHLFESVQSKLAIIVPDIAFCIP